MELKDLLAKAHLYAELNAGKRISQRDMAESLGISGRTYSEYRTGGSSPTGMEALLDMFAMLKDEQVMALVSEWKNKTKINGGS